MIGEILLGTKNGTIDWDLDEAHELAKSIENNEELFYEVSTLVYYHLRAKLKFSYEKGRP